MVQLLKLLLHLTEAFLAVPFVVIASVSTVAGSWYRRKYYCHWFFSTSNTTAAGFSLFTINTAAAAVV